jgi:triacylglycerol lipase
VISVFLGSRYGPNNGFSTDWQPNDGVVNTISMLYDSTGKAVSYSGSSQLGKWNKMAQLSNMDHTAVMGITLLTEVLELYSAHAKLLLSLPLASSRRQLAEEADTDAAATKITAAITSLNAAASSAKTVQNLQSLCESPANDFAEAYCTNMLVGAAGAARHLRG